MKLLRLDCLGLGQLGLLWIAVAVGCGDDGGGASHRLDDYLPTVPTPTGEARATYAGEISDSAELIPGAAAHGMLGDYFLRNSRARFVVQAPTRVVGIIAQGGNLVDAVAIDANGSDLSEDHFGELSSFYDVARTCNHTSMEVLLDGSGGGAAVLQARGTTESNEFINFKGLGVFSIPDEIDPVFDDNMECATTYVLKPDSVELDVYWTFFNPNDEDLKGPFGTFSDTGGETEAFAPTRGFERAGIDAIVTLADPAPIDYVLYQGPGVAYGIVPRHDQPTPHAQFSISGISVMVFGADKLLDLLIEDFWLLDTPAHTGATHRVTVVVGDDAASVEGAYLAMNELSAAAISGTVAYSGPETVGIRVGVYLDGNQNGQLDDADPVRTYLDADASGAFSGTVAPGDYLIRAELKNAARSPVQTVSVSSTGATGLELDLPAPVVFDYSIVDDETGETIPGRLTVVGEHPAYPDQRVFETYDRADGVVRVISAAHGTSVDLGDGGDEQMLLPVGATYRVLASRGTRWSVASMVLTPQAGDTPDELVFRLREVVPTPGYVIAEFHQHSIGSMDSPVSRPDRIRSFIAEGVEFFSSTDHDFISDFAPDIEAMGRTRYLRSIPGLEVTPFAYGHFQAFPLEVGDTDPSHGAIDWQKGEGDLAMLPGDIFDAARSRGAQVIQVNHPRSLQGDFADIMRYFDRTGLTFDYAARSIDGDPSKISVPNAWMRLPEASVWDGTFNALEMWNKFAMKDSNQDGVREMGSLDTVMRDWFNFLSFGLEITALGNSDSHTVTRDPVGMPRNYIRISTDRADLEGGAIVDDVLDTIAGRGGAPRDVVVTNGPYIQVEVEGEEGSALGKTFDGATGTVTLQIEVLSPEWAPFDTIEVFINSTPTLTKNSTWMQPSACFTSRIIAALHEAEPCLLAPIEASSAVIDRVEVAPGFYRWQTAVSLTIEREDVALFNREGASGSDAWFVVRARGDRAIFPLLNTGAITEENLATLVGGTDEEINQALVNVGIPAAAVSAPVYVDFDGGGYTAPFAP